MSDSNNNWRFYKNDANEYRWSRKANNGNIIGAATEGYTNKANCIANAKINCFKGNEEYIEWGKWQRWS